MAFCKGCGNELQDDAGFCPKCGADQSGQPKPANVPQIQFNPADWHTFTDVTADRGLLLSAIGAAVAFLGALCPWFTWSGPSVLGISVSAAFKDEFWWLVALAAIAAGVLVFKKGTFKFAMFVGIGMAAYTVIESIRIMTSTGSSAFGIAGASPSFGVFVTLVGSGLLIYAGLTAGKVTDAK